MTGKPCLYALAACLIPAGMAAAQEPATEPPPVRDPAELSDQLDQLVREAIDGGLLTASQPETAVEAADAEGAPVPAPVAAATSSCTGDDPLDFALYQEVRRYQDLHAFKPDHADPEADMGPATKDRFIKAFLALGLDVEARTLLSTRDDTNANAMRQLAELLGQRNQPDIDFFREAAACHPSSAYWLSIALLARKDAEGVELLDDHFGTFRRLPFELRVRSAEIAIPALLALDGDVIASKLMADFRGDDFAASSRLRFQRALMGMETGNPDAEATVREFLSKPQFRDQALSAMVRNARPVDRAYRALMLDDVVQSVARARSDTEIAEALSFALRELSAGSRYAEMAELTGLTVLQSPPTQTLIRDNIATSLARDLGSDEPMRSLIGMHGLVLTANLLEAHNEWSALNILATQQAVRFGFASLADYFFEGAGLNDNAGEARAMLAFRRADAATVYAMADRFPRNQAINQLATLSAIGEGNETALSAYMGRLDLEPEVALALIEQDAASKSWVLPDRIYLAAKRTEDPDALQTVEQVLVMRKTARTGKTGPAQIRIASVSETLDRAGLALESMERRVR